MGGRRWLGPIGGAVLALLISSSCADERQGDYGFLPPPDYELGGQTGSLVPGCGVAPLSAGGLSVPEGNALAILYAQDCPAGLSSEQLALQGLAEVRLELVPLDGESVFLVRAVEGLSDGDYRLSVGAGPASELRVGAEVEPPSRFGTLQPPQEDPDCGERIRFELQLEDAALAYAPLSRFGLRIDGGDEQIWVDYGALPIESDAEGSRGVLELPRCGAQGCLEAGAHRLRLSVQVAGEIRQPDAIELAFELQCPAPDSGSTPGEPDSGSRCAFAAPAQGAKRTTLGLLLCLLGCTLRRRARPACRPF
jgi:hypothetical protein